MYISYIYKKYYRFDLFSFGDDMTEGNIIKGITKFAIPCILTRIIQNLYPLIDSLIVGKVLSIDGLAAVGIAGSLYSLFNDTFSSLVLGFSIITSKKFGAKNTEKVRLSFSNSITATVLICIIVSVFGLCFSNRMFLMLNTPENLMELSNQYISVLFIGFVFNILYNFISEMLRAIGDSKTPFILLVFSLLIHLLVLFPFTKIWGVKGTALSSVISYFITIIIAIIYIYKKVPYFRIEFSKFRLDFDILKESFNIGIPMALTSFVVILGVLVLSFITNSIGTEYAAAYSCASKIGYIITTPIFGFGSALAVFTSQNFGARNFNRIDKGIKSTLKLIFVLNILIFLISIIISKPLLTFMLNKNVTAINAGMLYLFIRCISMFVLTPAAIYKSVLPAIGKPFFSTFSGFLEIAVRFLFPFIFTDMLGFSVVPLTDSFSWLLLAIMLTFSFYTQFKKIQKGGELSDEK